MSVPVLWYYNFALRKRTELEITGTKYRLIAAAANIRDINLLKSGYCFPALSEHRLRYGQRQNKFWRMFFKVARASDCVLTISVRSFLQSPLVKKTRSGFSYRTVLLIENIG